MAWHSSGSSNDELVDNLVENGLIPSEGIASAFRSVDRIYFVPEGCADLAYEDRPLKEGNVHISAPHIYCTVVKHLEIKPDSSQSFLNIGVGTGYLSALVSIILGPKSQLYGVDIHSAVIDHCREATRVWKESIDEEVAKCFLFHGNGLSILPEGESRLGFDRIYVGAAIDSSDLPKLQCLLAPGGILVAPVDDRLTQVRRSIDDFTKQTITGVHFSPLLKVPVKSILIPAMKWSPACHLSYPAKFQTSVKSLLLCSTSSYLQPPRVLSNASSLLPKDVWFHILSFTNRKWFDPIRNETEILKSRLRREQDLRSQLEAERNTLQRQNLLLEYDRGLYVRLIRRMRNETQRVMNQQRDHPLDSQTSLSQDPLHRATNSLLQEADRILHMMEQDNEDEDNGMDVEDEDDEAPNLGLGLDQSMESDDDMLHDRSSRIQFRSVSITNEDL